MSHFFFFFFFFNDTATTEIYTLSLHDALPISIGWQLVGQVPRRRKGWGILPARGADPAAGWEEMPVPHSQMPWLADPRSEEHTSELQSQSNLVCRLLLEKKKKTTIYLHRL